MVTESNLSTETINFIIALLQILSNDTHSFIQPKIIHILMPSTTIYVY